ncbi:MAG: flagellar biosynthesis protein FlhB [Acidobacteriota bacterium]
MGLFRGNDGRTEKATPKRRSDASRKGQIARSPTVPSAFILLGLGLFLGSFAGSMVTDLAGMVRQSIVFQFPEPLTVEKLQQAFVRCGVDAFRVLAMLTALAMTLSITANVAQGGVALSTYRLRFRFENLNPASGLKRLLPGFAGAELAKNLLIIGLVAHLAYSLYREALDEIPRYILMSPVQSAGQVGLMLLRLMVKSGWYLLVIGAADYWWKRRQHEENLKMTKQDVKDEAKNVEGNPEVKSRIRRKQREIAMRRMMADVPKADVVITNPTHYAVALSYVPGKMSAPTVLAKGQGYVALRIREIAGQHKVPLVENKPLAQSLFKMAEVGQQIPHELFKAVAEVLAYIYKLRATRL